VAKRVVKKKKVQPQPPMVVQPVVRDFRIKLATYLLMEISPTGFDFVTLSFLPEPPEDLGMVTHGEGQALLFKLEKFDCSTEFARALENGEFLKAVKGRSTVNLEDGLFSR
jgi:hypothetical protein